jgi:cellulose biosynthesis protein BcsQ
MNLAAATALTGTRVLLLDADPLSNISTALNLADHSHRLLLRQESIDLPGILVCDVIPNLDVLSPYGEGPCTDEDFARLVRALTTPPVQQCYGCTIIDVPPFLGGSAAQLIASCDDYLLVMRAEEMAHRTLPAFLELVQRSSPAGHALPMRGILLTLPEGEEPGCRSERELRGRFGTRVLAEAIPYDDSIGKALRAGRIASHLYPDSPAARQYHQLAAKLGLSEGASLGIDVEEILQALRDASALVGPPVAATATATAPSDAPRPKKTDPLDVPLFVAPPEPVKPAGSVHRSRRLNRSGESLRQARPDRVLPGSASSPTRWKVVPANGQLGSEETPPPTVASPPPTQPTAHALAQLWPLWILLGAVLGGGLRLLPHPPSLLPVFVGLGVALLVIVFFLISAQKRAGSPPSANNRARLRSGLTKEAAPQKQSHKDFLSARLASLVSNSKLSRRDTDAN